MMKGLNFFKREYLVTLVIMAVFSFTCHTSSSTVWANEKVPKPTVKVTAPAESTEVSEPTITVDSNYCELGSINYKKNFSKLGIGDYVTIDLTIYANDGYSFSNMNGSSAWTIKGADYSNCTKSGSSVTLTINYGPIVGKAEPVRNLSIDKSFKLRWDGPENVDNKDVKYTVVLYKNNSKVTTINDITKKYLDLSDHITANKSNEYSAKVTVKPKDSTIGKYLKSSDTAEIDFDYYDGNWDGDDDDDDDDDDGDHGRGRNRPNGNNSSNSSSNTSESQKYYSQWKDFGSYWCYYDANGNTLKSQFIDSGNKRYYLQSDGKMFERQDWLKISGTQYYFWSDGSVATDWIYVSGTWYYMSPGSGAMYTGWLYWNNNWYYLNPSGNMQIGYKSISGVDYYFWTSGAMCYNDFGGDGYYYNKDGSRR